MKKIAQRIKRTLEERRKCRVVLDPGGIGDLEYFGKKFTMDRDEAEELAEEIWARGRAEAGFRWRKGSWAGEKVRTYQPPIERWRIMVESRAEHERSLRRVRRRHLLRSFRSLLRCVPSWRWR